jgi:hypothetical protein
VALLVAVTALPAFGAAEEVPYPDLERPDLEVSMQVDATDAQVRRVVERVGRADGARRHRRASCRRSVGESVDTGMQPSV